MRRSSAWPTPRGAQPVGAYESAANDSNYYSSPLGQMRRAELPRRLHTGVHRGALRQEPWGERDMMRTEVASECGVGRKQEPSLRDRLR